jgi:hypothetical protein
MAFTSFAEISGPSLVEPIAVSVELLPIDLDSRHVIRGLVSARLGRRHSLQS